MHQHVPQHPVTPAAILAELGIPSPTTDTPPDWFNATLDPAQRAALAQLTDAAGCLPPPDTMDSLRLLKIAQAVGQAGEPLEGASGFLAQLAARLLASEILKAAIVEKLGLGGPRIQH